MPFFGVVEEETLAISAACALTGKPPEVLRPPTRDGDSSDCDSHSSSSSHSQSRDARTRRSQRQGAGPGEETAANKVDTEILARICTGKRRSPVRAARLLRALLADPFCGASHADLCVALRAICGTDAGDWCGMAGLVRAVAEGLTGHPDPVVATARLAVTKEISTYDEWNVARFVANAPIPPRMIYNTAASSSPREKWIPSVVVDPGDGPRGDASSASPSSSMPPSSLPSSSSSSSSSLRSRVSAREAAGFVPAMVRPRPPTFFSSLGGARGLSRKNAAATGCEVDPFRPWGHWSPPDRSLERLPVEALVGAGEALAVTESADPLRPRIPAPAPTEPVVPVVTAAAADVRAAGVASRETASALASLRVRCARASRGLLPPGETARLSRDVLVRPGCADRLAVGPDELTALVESAPSVAFAVTMRFLGTPREGEYLASLSRARPSLNSMDVVNRLLAERAGLPRDFVPVFVSHCINACEALEDKYLQHRLVRLLCVFIENLIRTKIELMSGPLCVEIEKFCVSFSRIREAAELFRLLKQ